MASQETTKGRSTKVKVTAPLEAPTDFSDAISSIERDLNQHRLGTFRINAKDMSFKWADRNNRALTSMDRMNILLTSMQNGLYRTDIRHRMSGLISGDKIDKSISSPAEPGKMITLEDVRRLNEQAMFPSIIFPRNLKKEIEMQSGQHRMAVLQYLFPEKEENWWWIVTLYDRSMTLSPLNKADCV
jgi:hypothetical protein